MSLVRDDPRYERPIESVEQLVDFFRAGETPRADWRVGTEHEKLGLYAKTLEPIPYEGERGIHALLATLERRHGWKGLLDAEKLVGLERDGVTITLEPGGQLELSGAPVETIHETAREFREHIELVNQVGGEFGMIWLGLGMHPLARLESIPRMPRERHAIMRDYLAKVDSHGLYMMYSTAGVQANFDFSDEADAARKLRVVAAASPISTALFANSSVTEGALNGYDSRRTAIWRNTDPDRWTLLPFAFEPGFGEGTAYRRYTEWALDVPVMLIVREGKRRAVSRIRFRDFIARGVDGERATLADWNLHLTTLFPEVRLKRVIETRGADAVSGPLVCALPAFWKGLLYDDAALEAAFARVAHWTHAEVHHLHGAVARRSLDARTPDGSVLESARELVEIAREGLRRIGARNERGEDERIFLAPLDSVLERGTSPGREIARLWRGSWHGQIERLIEYAKY